MPKVYTPEHAYHLDADHPHADVSQFSVVETFLTQDTDAQINGEPERLERLVALGVTEDGRLFYHHRISPAQSSCVDLLFGLEARWKAVFQAIAAAHRLTVVECHVEDWPWVYAALEGSPAGHNGHLS